MNDERTAAAAKSAANAESAVNAESTPTAESAEAAVHSERAATEANATAETAVLRMLGLARRARKLAVGTDAVLDAVRSGKAPVALVASDASDRTKKQVGDKCASYGVTLIKLEADRRSLAAALGSKDGQTSACAVTDRNMAIKILSLTNT